MKKLIIAIIIWCGLCTINPGISRLAAADTDNWVDITGEVMSNNAQEPGWTKDPKGKIFKDTSEMKLKIVTSNFGEFLVDLQALKIFELKGDGSQNELPDVKLLSRDHGKSIVVRNQKMKIRCKLNDKVKGMANVQGIKAL
jgi:hypothetical protein